jgi:hypothetical protein
MMRAAVLAALAAFGLSIGAAEASDRSREPGVRKAPQVRGYTARRGGYSYNWGQTINTYGDSRSRYGSTNSFRDPNLDRQSLSGPFDHGFFFDSGIGRIGGSSPYLN